MLKLSFSCIFLWLHWFAPVVEDGVMEVVVQDVILQDLLSIQYQINKGSIADDMTNTDADMF